MVKIAGVDPGASGAAAVRYRFKGETQVYCAPFPREESELVQLFTDLIKPDVAYVEQVSGFIGHGHPGSRMFKFGMNYGLILGALQSTGCKVVKVVPRVWMKALDLGTRGKRTKVEWKRHLKEEAKRLWPDEKVTQDNADALLILKYAINKETNQDPGY